METFQGTRGRFSTHFGAGAKPFQPLSLAPQLGWHGGRGISQQQRGGKWPREPWRVPGCPATAGLGGAAADCAQGMSPMSPSPFFFNPLEDLVLVALLCPAPIPGWSRALVWWEATERPVAAPAPALPLP